MKNYLRLLMVLLLFQAMRSKAQQIYGLAKRAGTAKAVYLSSVDPVTGLVTIMSDTLISQHLSGGVTLDHHNGNYYYRSPGVPALLHAVDIANGELNYTIPWSLPEGHYFDFIQYNCADSLFYGILRNQLVYGLQLATLDVATGVVSPLSATPFIAYTASVQAAYDPGNDIFYYPRNDNGLIWIRMSDGEILGTTEILLANGEYFENMSYNCDDGYMYGTYRNAQGLRFARLDIVSGEVTVLSGSPFLIWINGMSHILDKGSGLYYFATADQIFTIDIASGQVIDSPMVSFSLPGDFQLYHIRKGEDCECSLSVAVDVNLPNDRVDVYPNPVTNEIFIQTNEMSRSEIIIYDLTARRLLEGSFIRAISMNLEHLPSGIYLYELKRANGTVMTGKLIKE